MINDIIQEVSVMLDIGNHPNVVQFFGYCIESGNQCMVMQYFDGGSVCKLITDIDKGVHVPITENQQWNILTQAAAGILFLHGKGIIHRDIATRNLLYRKVDYVVGVSDFGMSRNLSNDGIHETMSVIGPVRWMSPESIRHR